MDFITALMNMEITKIYWLTVVYSDGKSDFSYHSIYTLAELREQALYFNSHNIFVKKVYLLEETEI